MKPVKSLSALVLAGVFLLILNSCNEFDQGGLVSKTEKNLVTTWSLQKYLRNDVDETSSLYIKNYVESYSDNQGYTRTFVDKDNKTVTQPGSWKFDKGQERLNISGVGSMEITDQTGTVSSSYYDIIKLDKNEFWYSYTNGSAKHEFRLVKQ